MKPTDKELDSMIEKTFGEIRMDAPAASDTERAAGRVLNALSTSPATMMSALPEHIRGCDDFQALIPAYMDGTLSQARTLLLEDHTRECIPCRKALKLARTGFRTGTDPLTASKPRGIALATIRRYRWAAAASVIVGVALLSLIFGDRLLGTRGGFEAVVYAMSGSMYHVSESQTIPLQTGGTIKDGQKIRAGKDSDAMVRLPDGSMIELKARSEISFSHNSDGTTIHLDRGNIIVQAADQGSHHLYVATGDCMVSVHGTIFSVDSGVKGSRVSVVQGEVQVDYAGEKHLLKSGQQVSTNPELQPVPVTAQVSWSNNQGQYYQLLDNLKFVKKEVAYTTTDGVRYSSDLLNMMPANTAVYVGLPNLSSVLKDSNRIIDERIKKNPAVADWWKGEGAAKRSEIVNKIAELGQYIGNEIAVSAAITAQGNPGNPLVVADLTNPAGFRSSLEQQVSASASQGLTIDIIDNPATAATASVNTLYVWITGYNAAASNSLQPLKDLQSAMAAGSGNPFLTTSFYADINATYQQGVSEIVAADLQNILAQLRTQDASTTAGQARIAAYDKLGLFNLKHFILESRQGGDSNTAAVLSFSQSDHGIVSWLAQPGPMGTLDFISPDATVVAAFSVKSTASMVDDILSALGSISSSMPQDLNNFQTETGIDIKKDLAAPLGGEYAFAIDGPLAPSPSWKLVVEVYDQATFQQTIQKLVTAMNTQAAKDGKPASFSVQQTEISGQTYFTLTSAAGDIFSYTFANAFMVAAPNKGVLANALKSQQSGYTLVHSSQFQSALPSDGNTNFSAIVYSNLGAVAGPIASLMGGLGHKGLKAAVSSGPSMAYAVAQGDRILFGATGQGGPLGFNPANMLGLSGAFSPKGIVKHSL